MSVSYSRKIEEYLFKLFDRGFFNYLDSKDSDGLPREYKQHLYELYLKDTSFAEKLDLLNKLGDDTQLDRTDRAFLNIMNTDSYDDYSYFACNVAISMAQVLDEILVDYFNQSLYEWNLYNHEKSRYPTDNEMDIATDYQERVRSVRGFI